MKIFVFLIGVILSVWVGVTVYGPAEILVSGVKEVYITSQVALQKTGSSIDKIKETDAYKEVARIFGMEGTKEAVKSPENGKNKTTIEKLFEYNLALWIAIGAGFLTFSLYLNILSFIGFFLKPFTFLAKR